MPRFMERQVHKMQEGSSYIVAFDGTLEELNAPDEQENENDEPSYEVHDFNFILCVEHIIENALQRRPFFSLIER